MSLPDFDAVVARADLCRLLAACYYEPGPEWAEERLFDTMTEAAHRLDPDLGAEALELKTAHANADGEELLVDYAKLFLGPGATLAPPYESAWRAQEDDFAGESTQALIELYDAGGFELDPDFRDLPDHVAVELEFLYTLEFQLAASLKANDGKAFEHAGALRWALLNQHLGAWIDPFANALGSHAVCDFYRQLGKFTAGFLTFELMNSPRLLANS